MGVKHMNIRQALQHVADNPEIKTDEIISLPVYELVSRTLFELANSADLRQRGSMSRANVARKMIFDRMVGKRRAGSHPARRRRERILFHDLTGEVEK